MDNFGRLYIVATPIGNLQDMTFRAVDVLRNVDIIAAEDTRHSARLLQHYQIVTPMVSHHQHKERESSLALIEQIREGKSVALISDAGTPLISDPGYHLVTAARQAGIAVVPLPGANAAITALSASGLPCDHFCFEGFLAAKTGARERRLHALQYEPRSLVFYEAPHRILASLQDMQAVFGPERECVVARELTKQFETFLFGTLAEVTQQVAQDTQQQRGEIVVIIKGYNSREQSLSVATLHVLEVLKADLSAKQAIALTAKLTGAKKNTLYKWLLDHKE